MKDACRLALVVSLSLAPLACSSGGTPAVDGNAAGTGASSSLAPPAEGHGFQILTPEVTIAAGDEKFYCFYTSIPATTDIGITKFESAMTQGSHHMILFATDTPRQPDGTLVECPNGVGGFSGKGPQPTWTFASQATTNQLVMPDGVGAVMAARQPLIVNMHYLNPSSSALKAHVTINVETFAPGEQFTPAAAFTTFNAQIDIPPSGTQSVTGSCSVPTGANFFSLTTHSHMYTRAATISDGSTPIVTTTDWQHPAVSTFSAPYLQFASGKLTYGCDYMNPTSKPIVVGESATENEMCMAAGYFFPATSSVFCLNDTIVH